MIILFTLGILYIETKYSKPIQPKNNQTVNTNNLNIYRDIEYTRPSNTPLTLDIYSPKSNGLHPAVIVIHGGGFAHHTKQEGADTAIALAKDGFVIFNIDYRLTEDNHPFPAALEDVRNAALWVRQNGTKYQASITKIGALGGSAGANLADMLATTGTTSQDKVDVAISLSAPTAFDLVPTDQLSITGGGRQSSATNVATYLHCTFTQLVNKQCDPTIVKAASPAYQVTSDDSPIYIANSQLELTPLNNAILLADQMQKAGVPYELKSLPGARHAFKYFPDIETDVVAFLHKYLD